MSTTIPRPPMPSIARRIALAWHVLRGRPLIFRAVLRMGDDWSMRIDDQTRGAVSTSNIVLGGRTEKRATNDRTIRDPLLEHLARAVERLGGGA